MGADFGDRREKSYCASSLIGHADGSYTIGFAPEGENNGNGTSAPGIPLPGETPWRTITIGETLDPIVETTVPFVCDVAPLRAVAKIPVGPGTWSWIIGMDDRTVYDEQIRYIDFSAALGYKSVLVDALWDTQIGREKIAELAKYGTAKNVASFYGTTPMDTGTTAPQGPRGIMDSPIDPP